MSDRLKELFALSGLDPESIIRMGVMPQAAKFAELIVIQCFIAAMAESQGKLNANDLMARMKTQVGIEDET